MTIDRRQAIALGAGTAALAAAGGITSAASAAGNSGGAGLPSNQELANSLSGFRSRFARVNGIRLHYVIGGQGEPLFLLHGWPQTWWEFRKVMPALADRYRVVAVDLRGVGGSDKPLSGYDKKNIARDIFELAQHLGFDEINIAGHDIGAMVGFSFAVNHPEATRKIAMLDVIHPTEIFYESPLLQPPGTPGYNLWFHGFNQIQGLPEQLVTGRARFLVDWVFDTFLVNDAAIGPLDRAIFAAEYNYPAAIRGGNGWYQAWHQDIVDQQSYDKVTAPILGLVHDLFLGLMSLVLPTQGTDVRIELVEDTGHYFIDEQPAVVVQELTSFFG